MDKSALGKHNTKKGLAQIIDQRQEGTLVCVAKDNITARVVQRLYLLPAYWDSMD